MKAWLRRLALLAIFLAAFAVGAVVTLPAEIAWSFVAERLPGTLYQPRGTVWDGRAAALQLRGHIVRDLQWRIEPAQLLRGRLAVAANAQPADGELSGHVHVAPGGVIELRDTRGNLALDTVLSWLRRGGLAPMAEGRIDATIRALTVDGSRLVSADGLIAWQQAAIRLGGRHELGELRLRLRPADGSGVTGRLTSSGGALSLDGSVELSAEGQFRFQATVEPAAQRRAAGVSLGRRLGLANPEGVTRLQASGSVDGSDLRASQQAVD